jgi:hypothetical protein
VSGFEKGIFGHEAGAYYTYVNTFVNSSSSITFIYPKIIVINNEKGACMVTKGTF